MAAFDLAKVPRRACPPAGLRDHSQPSRFRGASHPTKAEQTMPGSTTTTTTTAPDAAALDAARAEGARAEVQRRADIGEAFAVRQVRRCGRSRGRA